jgi:hypothetical protein
MRDGLMIVLGRGRLIVCSEVQEVRLQPKQLRSPSPPSLQGQQPTLPILQGRIDLAVYRVHVMR